jgi:hypothetical protein
MQETFRPEEVPGRRFESLSYCRLSAAIPVPTNQNTLPSFETQERYHSFESVEMFHPLTTEVKLPTTGEVH